MGDDLTPEEKAARDELIAQEAKRQADRIIKKNSRELTRLQKHAEMCLLEMNEDGYCYAIGKIRKIIRRPATDVELRALYKTSIERLVEVAKETLGSEGA